MKPHGRYAKPFASLKWPESTAPFADLPDTEVADILGTAAAEEHIKHGMPMPWRPVVKLTLGLENCTVTS